MSEKTKELVVQGTKTELEMAISETTIKNLIYVIRGQQVMLEVIWRCCITWKLLI